MARTLIEIESAAALTSHVASTGALAGAVVQGLDLTALTDTVTSSPAAGAVFLGCRMSAQATDHVLETGGVLFPTMPALPYRPYRPALYTIEELMAGYVPGQRASFAERTVDAAIYAHYDAARRASGPKPILEALGQRLHDHAVDDALHDHLDNGGDPLKVVGVMGGHSMRRDDPMWADVVKLGGRLTRDGFHVATGGGPGAMEAANLGAWLADQPQEMVARCLSLMAPAPDYRDDAWFDTSYAVREIAPSGRESLAVPTWFYGHEPTNLFATHVAKYFSNSLREDGLLAIAKHGLVFAPGSAGTIQEVFQDAAQNHYGTFGVISPMVFLGVEYWTRTRPVYPVLAQLAANRQYGELLWITDDVAAAGRFIADHPRVR